MRSTAGYWIVAGQLGVLNLAGELRVFRADRLDQVVGGHHHSHGFVRRRHDKRALGGLGVVAECGGVVDALRAKALEALGRIAPFIALASFPVSSALCKQAA